MHNNNEANWKCFVESKKHFHGSMIPLLTFSSVYLCYVCMFLMSFIEHVHTY